MVTYIGWAIVALTAWMLYKTKLGINIRAVGENPAAAKASGINVIWHQFVALAICGVSCSFGGMYLSMERFAPLPRAWLQEEDICLLLWMP